MVQDAWRLYLCVRAKMRTYMCGSGSGVAAVTIGYRGRSRDRRRLSRPQMAGETVTYTCVPYVYNWSQDVENCTLDLVLSCSTCTNAVQAVAIASKGWWFFLHRPLHTQDVFHAGLIRPV